MIIKNYVKHPIKQSFLALARRGMLNWLPDKCYLGLKFRFLMNKKIDWKNPVTFNEKLQWLKLYDRKPEYTKMVDKYEAKKYVASRIGEKYIIPTLGIWDNFDDIDFNSLPSQFVLKCTHDSGGLVICRDKKQLDIKKAKEKIEKSLRTNYYFDGREWPYKNVKPRIIAEQYMEDISTAELRDYKFFCFNGEPKLTLVCTERFSEEGLREDFFDVDWKHTEIKRPGHPNSSKEIAKPKTFEKMVKCVRRLSKDIPFLRVDFYEVNELLYFGEITFYPAAGFETFEPYEWDYIMGDWINLSERK